MNRALFIVVALSLFPAAHALAAPSRDWLADEMRTAQTACRQSQEEVDRSQELVREALALTAKAPAGDVAGRAVVREAELKARSALARNRLWHRRACARAGNLEKTVAAVPGGDRWFLPVYVQGEVTVDTGGGFSPWDGKSPLGPGQTIRTGKNGYAELLVAGGGELRIGPDAEFRAARDPQEMSVFEKGRFYYFRLKEALLHPEEMRYQIERGSACALAVRGTRFALVVDPGGMSRLALMDGEVALIDTRTGKETPLRAGQQVFFTGTRVLRGPEPIDFTAFGNPVHP